MKNSTLVICISTLCILFSCSPSAPSEAFVQQSLHEQYDLALENKLDAFKPLPSATSTPENECTPEKIELGHALYFDTRLSLNNSISCNSCHNLATGGVDNLSFSPGDAGNPGGRNSPTVLNAALHETQFWDGRAKDVEEQAGMPIMNPVEMAIPSEKFLVDRLAKTTLYPQLFKKAFPGEDQPLTYTNLRMAIAAFERQLLTPSRFDAYLNGDKKALTLEEKKGMLSFVNLGCTNCHYGVTLGGNSFQKFGMFRPYWELTGSEKIDNGKKDLSKSDIDLFVFKTPSLRNVSLTAPYFHDGSVKELDKAVEIMAEAQLDYKIGTEEKNNIVAFLKTLEGEVPATYKTMPGILVSGK